MTTPTFTFQVLEFEHQIDIAELNTWGAAGWKVAGFQKTEVSSSDFSNYKTNIWTLMMQKQNNE